MRGPEMLSKPSANLRAALANCYDRGRIIPDGVIQRLIDRSAKRSTDPTVHEWLTTIDLLVDQAEADRQALREDENTIRQRVRRPRAAIRPKELQSRNDAPPDERAGKPPPALPPRASSDEGDDE